MAVNMGRITRILVSIALTLVSSFTSSSNSIYVSDVACTISGMSVRVRVGKGFSGAIYTEKNYFNPVCRYNRLPALRDDILFFLPESNCGTDVKERDGYIWLSNVIIIQRDRLFEAASDIVHSVSCKIDLSTVGTGSPLDRMRHDIYETDEMKFWMEFKRGSSISDSYVTRTLEIGDEFFIAIHHGNTYFGNEIRVTKCWAHDRSSLEDSMYVIPFFDMYDCQPSEFVTKSSFDQAIVNSHVVLFAKVKAFKLPSVLRFYLTCSVEICAGECNDHCYTTDFNNAIKSNREKRSILDNHSRSTSGSDNRNGFVITDKSNLSRADSRTRVMEERVRLMKATIKALGKTILTNQVNRPLANDISFLRRASKRLDDDTETPVAVETARLNDSTVPTTTKKAKIPEHDDLTTVTYATTSQGNLERDRVFTLTGSVIVLHRSNSSNCSSGFALELPCDCVTRLRFFLVTSMLSILAFLLLFVSIALAIVWRHEKKRNRMDSFLLYNFR